MKLASFLALICSASLSHAQSTAPINITITILPPPTPAYNPQPQDATNHNEEQSLFTPQLDLLPYKEFLNHYMQKKEKEKRQQFSAAPLDLSDLLPDFTPLPAENAIDTAAFFKPQITILDILLHEDMGISRLYHVNSVEEIQDDYIRFSKDVNGLQILALPIDYTTTEHSRLLIADTTRARLFVLHKIYKDSSSTISTGIQYVLQEK